MASQLPYCPRNSPSFSYGPPLVAPQQQFQTFYPENSVVYPGQPQALPYPSNPFPPPQQLGGPSQQFCGPPQPTPLFPFTPISRGGGGQYRPPHYGNLARMGWGRGRGRGVGGVNQNGRFGNNLKSSGGHFECKPCDKVYKNEESYQLHLASHEKCPSCEFKASTKVVRDHQMVHNLPEFLTVTSKEDIEKWREERRKNFPTKGNIARKKKMEADKQVRGETAKKPPLYRYVQQLVGDDSGSGYGGNNYRSRRGRGRGRGQFRGRRGQYNHRGGSYKRGDRRFEEVDKESTKNEDLGLVKESDRECTKKEDLERVRETDKDCKKDRDLGKVEEFDKECERNKEIEVENEKQAQEVASSGLEKGYSEKKVEISNRHSEEDVGREKVCGSVVEAIMADMASQTSENDSTEDRKEPEMISKELECGNGEIEKSVVEGSEGNNGEGKDKRRPRKRWNKEGKGQKNIKRKKIQVDASLHQVRARKPTLLEKLLAAEVRQEQNIMLQCIRHVVSTDFLQNPKPPSQEQKLDSNSTAECITDHSIESLS